LNESPLWRFDAGREEIPCSSYREAIDLVGEKQYDVTVAKIVDKDGKVVFPSHDMDIDAWESVWQNEKRRLSIDIEDHHCPYDSSGRRRRRNSSVISTA